MPTDTTLTRQTAGGEPTLGTLGARIEALHQAACGEARTAMEHAVECGRLLLQAKALTGHGAWLPWLQTHCTIGLRQAQRYMRLVSHPEALAKCDSETYLPLSRALARIAVPRTKDPPEQDAWAWAEAQLSAPFDNWEFKNGSFHWCTVKLLHHLKVPTLAAVWLAEVDEFDLPLLRLCGYDELLEAVRRLAPAANGDAILPFADQRLHAMVHGANYIELCASRALGMILNELNHRQQCSEQQYLREHDEVLTRFQEQCDQRLAELETAGATEATKERQRQHAGTAPGKHSGKISTSDRSRVRDKLAVCVGVSGRKLEKAKAVVEADEADPVEPENRA